jgi:hypothetical protein
MMVPSNPERHHAPITVIRVVLVPLIALILWGLVACNLPFMAPQNQTPTLNVTQAYQTVEANLTQAVVPSTIESPLPTQPGDTPPPATTEAPPPPTKPAVTKASPTPLCDLASPGMPIDVTIPDDTEMAPGASFTKTWRLENIGTCTWTTDYALTWFSGERLAAPVSVPLEEEVVPDSTVELSVDMVAPTEAGTYQSNWKLTNASGELFGIGPNGNAAFWVKIVVLDSATATITTTLTATNTPTPTPTEPVQVSGSASLLPGDTLDLNTNQTNSGIAADLVFTYDEQNHFLDPIGSAAMAVFGTAQPTISDCQTITLSADPQIVEGNLTAGTYLCYRTNMALPGWALVTGFDSETSRLDLQILTWTIP